MRAPENVYRLLLFEHVLLVYISYRIPCVFANVNEHRAKQKQEKAGIRDDGDKTHDGESKLEELKWSDILTSVFKAKLSSRNSGRNNTQRRLKEIYGKRQMIAPGYYQAECSEKKPCKKGMYCNVLYCEDCHKLNVGCNMNKQCCEDLTCTFGRCEKKSLGDPGTFCEKDSDCKDGCCVLEPTINSHLPICKRMLAEYHQCAAILFRKIWVGEKPDCGPCKPGLECVQKGVFGSHEVCMKPDKS